MKKLRFYLTIFALIVGSLFIFGGSVHAASLEKTTATIYAIDDYDKKVVYKDISELSSIPSNLPQTCKIVVKDAKGTPTFTAEDRYAVSVDASGNVTPATISCAYVGIGTFPAHSFGEQKVIVKVDGQTLEFTVNIVDYVEYYCENKAKEWAKQNLTSDLTNYQKFEKIVKHVAEDYDYNASYSSYYSMMLNGGGDCWASSDAIVKLCDLVGIKAHIKNSKGEPGAGSGHKNAVALIDGQWWKGEAGYNEKKPRYYRITELPQGYDAYTYYNGDNAEYRLLQYEGENTEISIPSKLNGKNVSKISAYFCYYSYPSIKAITLPNTIKTIESQAFGGNYGLEKINIPDSVETIGEAPFAMSTISAKNVTVGTKYSIANNALLGDDGKTYIQAFYGAPNGVYTVPAGVTKINPKAFYISGVESVKLPSSLKNLSTRAFEGSGVKSVTVLGTTETIEEKAFSGASSLNTVIINNGVKSIGNEAFAKCSKLSVLRIPSSVTSIGTDLFSGVSDTSNITIYGVKGSAAETYAKNNNIKFVEGTKYAINKSMQKRGEYIFTYNGKSQKPEIEIIFNGNKLVEGTDYTITYNQSTVNASSATNGITYVVKGKGNYTGEFEDKYYINKAYWDFELIVPDVPFGTPVTPQITNGLKYDSLWYRPIGETGYWYGGVPNKLGEYEYEARIKEDDNHFSTTRTATNKITGTPLKSISIKGNTNELKINYDTTLEVVYNPSNASVDKTNVKWTSSNRDIATVGYYTGRVCGESEGTAIITAEIEGKKATYTITVYKEKKDISELTINVPTSNVAYTGSATYRTIKIYDGSTLLKKGTNYKVEYKNNVNIGTATITITGIGKYTGTVTKTYKIVAPSGKKDISKLTVSVPTSNVTYTGSATYRTIKIKDGSTTLKKNTDYTVEYKNNVNIGTATITITGKGNYVGTIVKTYKIVASGKKDISKLTVNVPTSNVTYTGSATYRTIKIYDGGTLLKKGTDYTVEYKNNVNIGTATITITGKGDYVGTITKTYKIVVPNGQKDISKLTISVPTSDVKYTGSATYRTIKIYDGSTLLKKGTDYTVVYKNNINVGTATITITGKGNYAGIITKSYKIVAK